jgi:hypothetical protein
LSGVADFVKINTRFDVANPKHLFGKEVLVIGLRMNWVGLAFLLLSNLAVCVGAGFLAGFVTGRVDLGVAVTSGVASILSCTEAVLFLVFK